MNFKWFGPLALLAALVIGDQIRINRPGHKYRLTVEVETPEGRQIGLRRHGGPSRPQLQPRRPDPHHGRCRFRRSRRRQEPRRAAGACRQQRSNSTTSTTWRLRAYTAAGRQARVVQPDEPADRHRAGEGRADPGAGHLRRSGRSRHRARGAARRCRSACWARAIASAALSAEVVPNGYWPLDFGGALGEPVTRGIEAKLPWLNGAGQCGGHGAPGGRIARGRGDRCPGGFHAKIAGQARCRSAWILIRRRLAGMIFCNHGPTRKILAQDDDSGIFAMRTARGRGDRERLSRRKSFRRRRWSESAILRAVADVAGALPLMFAGSPEITDIGALLDVGRRRGADRRPRQCSPDALQDRAA